MPRLPHSLLSYLRVVAGAWCDDPREDAELLAHFAESSDEGAFKALVYRHGPLVWRSCMRVLGDGPDAEDAFQTAFLALAHQAGRLRREPLAGWLHRVARRAALKVDLEAKRRRGVEQHLRAVTLSEAMDLDRAELYAALDEELAGLPERLRVPLLLRYLENKTLEDAARIVGCSRRDLGRRLAKGETLLRERLERRGLTVGVGSVAVLLGISTAASAMPRRLLGSTARAAVAFRSGSLTGGAAEAAQAILGAFPSSLGTTIMRKSLWIVLACSLGLGGAGLVTYRSLSAQLDEPGGVSPAVAQTSRQSEAAARDDCLGDPLPAYALARMGTTRLYYRGNILFTSTALAFSPDGKILATHIDGMRVCLWDAVTGKEIHRLTTKAVKGGIVSLGFSRDGKTLIAVNWEQTVCRWEVATGKVLRKQEYQGPKRDNVQDPTVAFFFLPDGKMLGFETFQSVEKGRGGAMRGHVWDVATGKEICQLSRPMKEGEGRREQTAFSPDGKMLATVASVDGTGRDEKIIISLWDVATGKEIRQLTHEGENAGVGAVAFSRDGKTLASGHIGSEKICVWEVATGKKIHLLKPKSGMQMCDLLTFSPNGKTLLGGIAGHLWDVATGEELRSFGCEQARVALFSPDGKILVVGDQAGSIRLWEVATGKEIGPRKEYRGGIRSVVYSPDGKMLASMGQGEKMVRLWEVASGKEIRQLAKGSYSFAYSPDGKTFVSTMNDSMLPLCDTATGKEIRQFKCGEIPIGVPHSAAFSPNGKKLVASVRMGNQDVVHLWEVATGKKIYTLVTEVQNMDRPLPGPFVFSPDGRLLAGPGRENTVSLWEVATGNYIGQLVGPKPPVGREHRFLVRHLAFSPDGRMLATSSWEDEKVRVWEVASGKEIWQLDGLKPSGLPNQGLYGDSCTLAFSLDSRMLATAAQGRTGNGYFDPTVHLWDMVSGKEIGRLAGHQAPVQTLAFSPDGKTLASGSDDLTCLIWDVTPFGGQLKPVPARPLPVQALSQEQLEAAWTDLAKDPAKAYAAIRALQGVPTQAIALLRSRVQPVAPLSDRQQLKRWIVDLDDNRFTVRDKAQQEIAKLGEAAIPALRQALKGQPVLEAKRRLQGLLAVLEPKVFGGSPRRLRELRAVQVLESIDTAESRQVLQALAKGVSEASLTRDAQAALVRLAKRSAARP